MPPPEWFVFYTTTFLQCVYTKHTPQVFVINIMNTSSTYSDFKSFHQILRPFSANGTGSGVITQHEDRMFSHVEEVSTLCEERKGKEFVTSDLVHLKERIVLPKRKTGGYITKTLRKGNNTKSISAVCEHRRLITPPTGKGSR